MKVEPTRRAVRDLRKLHPEDRTRVLLAMRDILTRDSLPANADDKPLEGRSPWRRLRVGELRLLWYEHDQCRYVGRIVHRRDLERAVHGLQAQ